MSKQALKRVRRAIGLTPCREALPSFAWPGGYPMLYYFADGGVCCPLCANKNIALIDDDIKGRSLPRPRCGGWALAGAEANYEVPTPCDNCGKMIEAAYADEVGSVS